MKDKFEFIFHCLHSLHRIIGQNKFDNNVNEKNSKLCYRTFTLKEIQQLTDKIVMVRPNYFGYNPETGVDNRFQHQSQSPEGQVREAALREFGEMVTKLDSYGLSVVILDSPLGPNGEITPDAVFPNNWFSTHPEKLVLYPMKAQNRRWERQPNKLKESLLGVNVLYPQTLDLTADENSGHILEGTGSLVLDRVNKVAYAVESQRTNEQELNKWSMKMGYAPLFFHAIDFGGKPVYHTNVIMSIGEGFAVVCSEAIELADEKDKVVKSFANTGKDVVEITMDQMYNMCGNILQTSNIKGDNLIVMSERAQNAFNQNQLRVIEKNGLIVPVKIETIETVGGGSARCMMAEVF